MEKKNKGFQSLGDNFFHIWTIITKKQAILRIIQAKWDLSRLFFYIETISQNIVVSLTALPALELTDSVAVIIFRLPDIFNDHIVLHVQIGRAHV